MLSDKDLERFSRQIIIDKIGFEGQKKLNNSSILIVGCGGLGTSASQYLAMSGIGKITLLDDDIINLSNLNRQTLFQEKDIGKFKVKVLASRLKKINQNITIKTFCERLEKSTNHINDSYDVILDCSDNFETRYLINKICFNQKKKLISAALQNFDIQILTFSPWKKKEFPCYECVFPKEKDYLSKNCDQMGILAPIAGMGGVFQALNSIIVILNIDNSIYTEMILFDGLSRMFKKIRIFKNPRCLLCGSKKS